MIDESFYNPATYRNMVKMSKHKYILVEGKDDKITFRYLIQELFLGKRLEIKVHGAHQIRFGSNIGNRERVETISESVKEKKYAKRFVGFVDREFRGFRLDHEINDSIEKHNVLGRLVWSRGHSLENYYFDFSTLRRPLRDFSTTPYFEDAMDLFEQKIEQTIKIACAVGLAGNECGILEPVKTSIDWKVLEFNESEFAINTVNWLRVLISKKKIRSEDAYLLVEAFQSWFPKVSATDLNTVRWLCHGHIGITVIWAAYARCVFEVCARLGCEDPHGEVKNVLGANEAVRCNRCASEWAQQILNKSCEYPAEIFTLLDL